MEIIALSVGILIGFGMGFYSVYNYYKMKILLQEVNYDKEKQKLLEENLLLVKALNDKTLESTDEYPI